jgi:hypothetical protein
LKLPDDEVTKPESSHTEADELIESPSGALVAIAPQKGADVARIKYCATSNVAPAE